MRYIKLVPKMRYAGKGENGDMWINTMSIVKLVVRSGKVLNTGINVIAAKKIADACEAALAGSSTDGVFLKLKSKYLALEDKWHELLMRDLGVMNFSEIGLVNVVIAEDVEAIASAMNKAPEDDGEYELEYVGRPTKVVEKTIVVPAVKPDKKE
ncbi:MAG: hypothetical protein HQK96_08320 [Nitrospirae bacterium]|nr:hypothetical protein [Nitrospirota bacterium]